MFVKLLLYSEMRPSSTPSTVTGQLLARHKESFGSKMVSSYKTVADIHVAYAEMSEHRDKQKQRCRALPRLRECEGGPQCRLTRMLCPASPATQRRDCLKIIRRRLSWGCLPSPCRLQIGIYVSLIHCFMIVLEERILQVGDARLRSFVVCGTSTAVPEPL